MEEGLAGSWYICRVVCLAVRMCICMFFFSKMPHSLFSLSLSVLRLPLFASPVSLSFVFSFLSFCFSLTSLLPPTLPLLSFARSFSHPPFRHLPLLTPLPFPRPPVSPFPIHAHPYPTPLSVSTVSGDEIGRNVSGSQGVLFWSGGGGG